MATINSLYKLFGLSPNCTDDELRQSYRRLIREHHPDMNPDHVKAATAKTQQLTAAYAEIKNYRKYLHDKGIDVSEKDVENDWEEASETTISVTVTITFTVGLASSINLEDIAKRKHTFRRAWNSFRQNPADVIQALRLVHAAFEAERQDAVYDLLTNTILIDAASLLMYNVEIEGACDTLIRWADILYQNRLANEGIQVLEDGFAAIQSNHPLSERIANKLRSMHYGFAQGYTPETLGKPSPKVRVKHLNRILELGFKFDYIYKLLAEAFYEIGDNKQAHIHLEQAYKINPQLSGAMRISRALGLLPEKQSSKVSKSQQTAKYKYTRPEHIPSPSQIRQWEADKQWDQILAFADLSIYSPRIIPKSRNAIRQIARSLGSYHDSQAVEALTKLLDSVYWDVRRASVSSLAQIGDHNTLKLLQSMFSSNGREDARPQNAISYLQSRIQNKLPTTFDTSTSKLIEHAKQAIAQRDYGQARFLLEHVVTNIDRNHKSYLEIAHLLAQTYAEMDEPAKAINLMKPILTNWSIKSNRKIYEGLTNWLWNYLVFEEYDPANDEEYLLALNTHFELVLATKKPDETLGNLRRLTRWMELLGEGEMAQWIRSLIRITAPGTWYVDSYNREQYIRQVQLSSNLREQLITFHERIRTDTPKKLSEVFGGPNPLPETKYRLSDGRV